jgi:two-component system, NtrC family, response regulator GlrR
MRVQLQWVKDGSSNPSGSGSAYLSEGESATIGRETGVDILLTDRSVSRLHAEVYMEDGAVIIKDAGSTNGTILDGKQVVQAL